MSLLWFIALLAAFALIGGTGFLAGMVYERGWRCDVSGSDELGQLEQWGEEHQ